MLAILKESVDSIRRTTPDGVEYFDKVPEGQSVPAEKISADLGNEYFVYDIRAGKFLGKTATVQDELASPDQALCLTVLPGEGHEAVGQLQ